MSFFISIGAWIIKFATSDLIVSIIKKLIDIFLQYIKDVVPMVLDEIVKASKDSTLDSSQKFDAVYGVVSAKFGQVPTSILRVIIEVCYTYLKDQLPNNK